MKYKQTPSQTIGPFFAHGLTPEQYHYNFSSIADGIIADATVEGEQLMLTGRVFDGHQDSAVDAMLEFWQCDASGQYLQKEQDPNGGGFRGFGRVGTGMNLDHYYEIRTVKPRPDDGSAPHINLIIFMRGMLNHQYTRIYFSDEEKFNEEDAILNLVPKERRSTLIAKRMEMGGLVTYHFDIQMQGEHETVFFDL